jgi:hypothetical protein
MWSPALFRAPSMGISSPSEDRATEPGQKKNRTSLPMLAKRFIVVAFALAVIGLPFALSGRQDLFLDGPLDLTVASTH